MQFVDEEAASGSKSDRLPSPLPPFRFIKLMEMKSG
jgi:hypothetical protein